MEENKIVSAPSIDFFDRDFLSAMTPQNAAKWCTKNFASFSITLAHRMKKIIYTETPADDNDLHPSVKAFAQGVIQKYINTEGGFFVGSTRTPSAHLLAYVCVTHPEYTVSKLVFNRNDSVILDDRMEFLCKAVLAIPESARAFIFAELRLGSVKSNNPCYTLHCRMEEIASRYGASPLNRFTSVSTVMYKHDKIQQLSSDVDPITTSLSYNPQSSGGSDLALSYYSLLVAIIISLWYDLSLDYLLIRDYSNIAVYKDSPMGEEDRVFLSYFLNAKPDVQANVMAKILWHNTH